MQPSWELIQPSTKQQQWMEHLSGSESATFTIPQLASLITVLTILAIGNIFRADFGLFYQIPHNSGALYSVTNVIDVYVYNGLAKSGDIAMAAAAGLYQSVVGLILVLLSNICSTSD